MCKLVAFCLLSVLESVDCSIKWIAGMRMRERWKDVIKDVVKDVGSVEIRAVGYTVHTAAITPKCGEEWREPGKGEKSS